MDFPTFQDILWPVGCILLNLLRWEFTAVCQSGFGRTTCWLVLSFIAITKERLTQIAIYLRISHMLSFISSKPSLVSVSGCSSMVFRALETSGLFKNGISYLSDLKSYLCRNLCTQMPFRPNMSSVVLTCSHSSSTGCLLAWVPEPALGPSMSRALQGFYYFSHFTVLTLFSLS